MFGTSAGFDGVFLGRLVHLEGFRVNLATAIITFGHIKDVPLFSHWSCADAPMTTALHLGCHWCAPVYALSIGSHGVRWCTERPLYQKSRSRTRPLSSILDMVPQPCLDYLSSIPRVRRKGGRVRIQAPDQEGEGREIRTPNLLIWSQTRCRCAIPPHNW